MARLGLPRLRHPRLLHPRLLHPASPYLLPPWSRASPYLLLPWSRASPSTIAPALSYLRSSLSSYHLSPYRRPALFYLRPSIVSYQLRPCRRPAWEPVFHAVSLNPYAFPRGTWERKYGLTGPGGYEF
jgi:hypothetical protein